MMQYILQYTMYQCCLLRNPLGMMNPYMGRSMVMEKAFLFLAALVLGIVSDSTCYYSVEKVFYVKPTTGSKAECPSGDSPCHSLQYYANHSNFTNSSRFIFLEGEHHLDRIVDIRNVANLSLVGAGFEVNIVCKSLPSRSGFHVEKFIGLSIENLTISNCSGSQYATLYLVAGSELSLDHVVVSYEGRGLEVTNVVGSVSVCNSTFYGGISVKYSLCNGPSDLKFGSNRLTFFQIIISCSNVQILVTASIFGNISHDRSPGLSILFERVANNSVLDNSIFRAVLEVSTHSEGNTTYCGHDLVKLTHVTVNSFALFNLFANCTILIEDSTFSSLSDVFFYSSYSTVFTLRSEDKSLQARLINVTFAETICRLADIAVLFVGCSFENNIESAIQAEFSKVMFAGNNRFKNNSARIGAGIQLVELSYLALEPNTSILFEDNHADYVGGAIYFDGRHAPCTTRGCWRTGGDACYYYIYPTSFNSVEINFVNNTADFAGSALYGDCTGCKDFPGVFSIANTEADPSAVASDPSGICLCKDGKRQPQDCSNLAYFTHAFPGQEFPVRLAVTGCFNGAVPGGVRAYFDSPSPYNTSLGLSQSSQASSKPFCKDFMYSVNTIEEEVIFKLTPELFCLSTVIGQASPSQVIEVTVFLDDCPLGFLLSSATGKCVCDGVLTGQDNVACHINDQSILRPANSWIGYVTNSSTPGVIFHPNCPIGYCLSRDTNITINTTNSQCESNRTGLLCGECENGYSLTLGDGKCMVCSNTYLLLLIPAALLGLLMVTILFALNLTVTEGNINGLVFYADVMGMSHTILFSGRTTYLYTFLAWLNLDFGISTCLYNGLDGYAETWLQFVFPIYLWMIILVIIQFYRKFPTHANRLGGENAVKVLATLFLLSYTKLQRTVVTILSFTWLEYPDGEVRYVWLYDANVEFFKGKHLYLGIAGILVLVFFIVPYTLCLAFFQRLQACSGRRLFQWVNKLKPVFDSYAGPYKDFYRFWTGMLLMVRTLLIILFTINAVGSVDTNLLIILVVASVLLVASTNGIYKMWPYNYIEAFFYLQLVVFAAGTLYARHNHGNVTAVSDTSIGLTLVIAFALVGYQLLCRIKCFKQYFHHPKGYADIAGDDVSLNQERIVT